MPRVLLAAVPLLAGLLPLTAGALGLGEINLRSALNEPFEAEIPVTGDTADELRQLEVRLASPEVFQRFGLDRPAFLNDFEFLVQAQGEQGLVRVTSPRAVSEPFVSLLVEVTWPAGRLLREYTVLLDPPAFARPGAAPPVSQPQTPGAASQVTRPAPMPSAPAPAPAPAPASTSGAGVPAAAPPAEDGAEPGSYGPVKPNETLWVIAQEVRTDPAISMNEMMLALFRANPEAFAGNINRLRAGAILRVPGAGEVASLAGADATAEVRRQNEEWRGAAASSAAPRLELVPPADQSSAPPVPARPAPAAPAGAPPDQALASELEQSRRLLEMKDRELKALQDRLSALEGQGASPPAGRDEVPLEGSSLDETALERLPDEEPLVAGQSPADAPADSPAAGAEVPADPDSPATPQSRAAPRPPAGGDESFLGTLAGLVLNAWFLGAAAIVLLGSLLLFRRRSAAEEEAELPVRDLRTAAGSVLGGAAARRDSFVVEEEEAGDRTSIAPAPRMSAARGDSEQPLEKTISADGGMEIDQADVVAEADFHMAYGLYDQAADLLTKALKGDPARRDLRLKLLEVYFIWENKGAFLKEARAFQGQIKGPNDPDWNKVLIMGKQLCPDDALFAGASTSSPSDSLDFSLDSDTGRSTVVDIPLEDTHSGTAVDLDLAARGDNDGLDFDMGDGGAGDTGTDLTTGLARTVEAPTVERPRMTDAGSESPTLETPTLESQGLGTPTVETPTLESAALGWSSTEQQGGRPGSAGDGVEQTQEINLEELGLDLAGLDEAAGDLAGTTGIGPGLGEGSTSDTAELRGLDSTAELTGLDEGTLDLPAFGTALEKSGSPGAGEAAGARTLDDTAEQPKVAVDIGTPDNPGDMLDLDLDLGLPENEEIEPTAVASGAPRRGPEGPTMTEVGTKLDLARAYIDMGDPDGARSILNEVLEEGDPAQQQEARKLLDELAD